MRKISFYILILFSLFSFKSFCQTLTLKINGKNKLETQVLDSITYLKSHHDYISISSEINDIQKKLYNLGYIDNELGNIKKTTDTSFSSQINLKNKYKSISIYYDKTDLSKSILNSISKDVFDDYFILNFKDIEHSLNFINSEISKKGHPFTKLKLSNIRIKDTSSIEAFLNIDIPKRKRTINSIIIKGYKKFPVAYLKNLLKIRTNQFFDIETIKNKTNRLKNLNFANEIKPPEVLFSKDSTSLYLYIEKTKSNTFDGFLGFGTNEETKKLVFDGYLNLQLINNLNLGESLKLLYKTDENNQQTFEINTTLPYLFRTPVGADFSLRIFKRDSSFTTINQSAKIHYQINDEHKFYTGISASESNNLLKNNTSTIITDYKTNYHTVSYEFIKRQPYSTLFPTKTYIYIETGFGNRKALNSKEKQQQVSIDASNIFNLNKNNSIYLRFNSLILNSNTYFENELLRFGGINSIRGFEENSIFASQFSFLNTEYRFRLNNSTYIHSIIDGGFFENKISNIKEKIFGYGFGFGIITKAGLLKFNYANGKNENTRFKFSNSKIHLSLVASF